MHITKMRCTRYFLGTVIVTNRVISSDVLVHEDAPSIGDYSLMGRVKECPIIELLQEHPLMGRIG